MNNERSRTVGNPRASACECITKINPQHSAAIKLEFFINLGLKVNSKLFGIEIQLEDKDVKPYQTHACGRGIRASTPSSCDARVNPEKRRRWYVTPTHDVVTSQKEYQRYNK